MILAFKPQFKQPILDGVKIHTLRADPNDRWHKGRQIQMATGVRTKNYNCFKEATCLSTQKVYMSYAFNDIIEITVGDKYMFGFAEREQFAKNDGFNNWEEFFDWFYPLIQHTSDNWLVLKLIHWTDKRY